MKALTKFEVLAVSGGDGTAPPAINGDLDTFGDLGWLYWLRTHQFQTSPEPIPRQPVSRNPLP